MNDMFNEALKSELFIGKNSGFINLLNYGDLQPCQNNEYYHVTFNCIHRKCC